ncbi:MAG: acyl-CoA dehydratase activase [Eubacteriales bacterium]|jgi:predicted CoA-substrate-specific enzyme activase
MKLGLDVGSTTLKCVVIDENQNNRILFKSYERHYSQIQEKTEQLLEKIKEANIIAENDSFTFAISGSAGMGFSENIGIPFVQEVYATRTAVNFLISGTDCVIELGGEDAKILFLTGAGGLEVRMNGSCAGGTGAFIDQMATLLGVTTDQMDELAEKSEKIYTVASRCGVFAKSDIQPLINQGARLEDISASIFNAVVNQTVGGLSQGRQIKGNVVYLGGPLTFLKQLRVQFDKTLGLEGNCPEYSLYYVSIGAAMTPQPKSYTLDEALNAVKNCRKVINYEVLPPLFTSEDEYEVFRKRHDSARIETVDMGSDFDGDVYFGIDAGSTTVKCVAADSSGVIIYSDYRPNSGNPVPIVKEFLENFYDKYPKSKIAYSAVTGYGEDIIKNAFKIDLGIVETIAHFTAAKAFRPDVDFIIDIGGQDIKCFKIRNGAIDNIFLNEACSSGCGSFLQTFAGALNMSIIDFAKLGLFADAPVDLGSRCTVFMNSSVKQAQKDGASIESISAGLSISVVKNALYKVIRAPAKNIETALGRHIVVQGGTFLNDAVLRAFETEIESEVVRPNIAGLMGAYGAALYAKQLCRETNSSIIRSDELKNFEHSVKAVTCGLCNNRCRLTVNTFEGGRRYIGGNRCERPLIRKGESETKQYNLYEYKLGLLDGYKTADGKNCPRGRIGIPMGLNMFELLPFWFTIFDDLGFEVIKSPMSNRKLYISGQHTIPSDTVCFPAKLMHGHIEALLDMCVEAIFYPCLTYNVDESKGENHYNCPVVAYYPEVLAANINRLENTLFIHSYFGIHRPKDFEKKFFETMKGYYPDLSEKETYAAVRHGYKAYYDFMNAVRLKGEEYIEEARKAGLPIIVLSGRPYHIDTEVNHGIDKLICGLGAALITEDSIAYKEDKFTTNVLNQWTYHGRLYSAAKYVTSQPDMNLVQLVSFGCGVDAITTDEVRSILEYGGKIYTMIKIDEITNLGAVKIRMRSLFSVLEAAENHSDNTDKYGNK